MNTEIYVLWKNICGSLFLAVFKEKVGWYELSKKNKMEKTGAYEVDLTSRLVITVTPVSL